MTPGCDGWTIGYVCGSYVDKPQMMKAGQNKYYFATNHLYSVAALTDSTGAVVERYKYDAYGRQGIMNQNGTVSYCPSDYGNFIGFIGFTGRYHDWETGLFYFRARMYDTELGRFIGRDPIRENPSMANAMDGYQSGMSMYSAYFIPNAIDSFGLQTVNVGPCEIAIVYGPGNKKSPVKFTFGSPTTSAGVFVGCWPGDSNNSISNINNQVPGFQSHNHVVTVIPPPDPNNPNAQTLAINTAIQDQEDAASQYYVAASGEGAVDPGEWDYWKQLSQTYVNALKKAAKNATSPECPCGVTITMVPSDAGTFGG